MPTATDSLAALAVDLRGFVADFRPQFAQRAAALSAASSLESSLRDQSPTRESVCIVVADLCRFVAASSCGVVTPSDLDLKISRAVRFLAAGV